MSGLIPAHAGKTTGRQVSRSAPWAHPRSRGENTCGLARADIVEGSSPLTRGKPLHPDSRAMHRGLIPAHAGKTSASTGRTQRRRAHPRSRGENWTHAHAGEIIDGSSPLTRGKPRIADLPAMLRGLIPAHAGKTCCRAWIATRRGAHPRSRGENEQRPRDRDRAHPRSRGENKASERSGNLVKGSSPLTRGKR